jgi:hypothetical protein
MSDVYIRRAQASSSGAKPENRLELPLTVPGAILLPIGVFIYGWTTEKGVHWIVPIIGTAFVGLGNLTGMMTIQTYLVRYPCTKSLCLRHRHLVSNPTLLTILTFCPHI